MTDELPFGFRVKLHVKTKRASGYEKEGWEVSLPHQCDEWIIAGPRLTPTGRPLGQRYEATPHDEVIAELENFIREATQALEALREGREFGNEEG